MGSLLNDMILVKRNLRIIWTERRKASFCSFREGKYFLIVLVVIQVSLQ